MLDAPGQIAAGRALLEELRVSQSEWHEPADRQSWKVPYFLLQGELTAANHRGEPESGEIAWQRNREMLTGLRARGLDGLKLEAELRNRHAVGLIDQFRCQEAIDVLRELVSERTKLVAAALNAYGLQAENTDGFNDDSLAACLGTLGQALVISGTDAESQAKECFFNAMRLFSEKKDQERQWICLGHLACQAPSVDKRLWQEVCGALPEMAQPELISADGSQYKLALQLKGLFTFESPERLESTLTGFDTALDGYSQECRLAHPFGLIHQAAATCAIRLQAELPAERWGIWRDFANRQFNLAATHMNNGGATLQLLSSACRMRQQIFQLSYIPEGVATGARQQLASALHEFLARASRPPLAASWQIDEKGRCNGCFGVLDPGDSVPLEARTAALLSGIRFNYC
jgi:hypothetical protein